MGIRKVREREMLGGLILLFGPALIVGMIGAFLPNIFSSIYSIYSYTRKGLSKFDDYWDCCKIFFYIGPCMAWLMAMDKFIRLDHDNCEWGDDGYVTRWFALLAVVACIIFVSVVRFQFSPWIFGFWAGFFVLVPDTVYYLLSKGILRTSWSPRKLESSAA